MKILGLYKKIICPYYSGNFKKNSDYSFSNWGYIALRNISSKVRTQIGLKTSPSSRFQNHFLSTFEDLEE